MTELKPCPFCGTKVKMRFKIPGAWIYCKTCGAYMERSDDYAEGDSKPVLAEAWNRRTVDD